MKKQTQAFSTPHTTERNTESSVGASKLAVRESVKRVNPQASLDAILETPIAERQVPSEPLSAEWAVRELACAKAVNFELPGDFVSALARLEKALKEILNVRRCVILTCDEQTGVYTCLEAQTGSRGAREMNRISDWFLQELLGSGQDVIYSDMIAEDGLNGMVLVSEKLDNTPFATPDQTLLDLMMPYLAVQIVRLMKLKALSIEPEIESVRLELAEKLVMAVDQEAIIPVVLESMMNRFGLLACQYTSMEGEPSVGEVLFEARHSKSPDDSTPNRIYSYTHAGFDGKRRTVKDYANLVGLLDSPAHQRACLQLNGKKLGTRTLADIFGLRGVQSVLVLPVIDIQNQQIRGTLNLFPAPAQRIDADSQAICIDIARLTSYALSRSQVLEKALTMASSDELTRLTNRRGYYQRFESELERARRHQTPLSVALIDVDHFKRFNDTFGHLSGDLILKALAELFVHNLRKSDVVCRFGGEEFAVLLPDTVPRAAADLLERVRDSVEKLEIKGLHGESLKVTISIGLAQVNTEPTANPHSSEISDALAQADEQLYIAKKKGRNRVCRAKMTKRSAISHAAG